MISIYFLQIVIRLEKLAEANSKKIVLQAQVDLQFIQIIWSNFIGFMN